MILGLLAPLALVPFLATGCEEDPVGFGGAPPDDGRFHPPKNGAPVDEGPACDTLLNTITKKFLALGCVGTSATCPSLVRIETKQNCAKYDEGTVQGCAKYINEGTDCATVAKRIADCAFEAIPDTAPAGCPAM